MVRVLIGVVLGEDQLCWSENILGVVLGEDQLCWSENILGVVLGEDQLCWSEYKRDVLGEDPFTGPTINRGKRALRARLASNPRYARVLGS